MPRDAAHIVSDLDAVLQAANLPGPYLLVGHSLGAQYVRLYARQHPDKVLGLVLIDPEFRNFDRLVGMASPANAQSLAKLNSFTRKCIGSLAVGRLWSSGDPAFKDCGPPPPGSTASSQAMAQATLSEFESRGVSADEVSRGSMKSVPYPIIVLTAGRENRPLLGTRPGDLAALMGVMRQEHQAIAATSRNGRQKLVPNSGHLIQVDQPQAVIDAVSEAVAMAEARVR